MCILVIYFLMAYVLVDSVVESRKWDRRVSCGYSSNELFRQPGTFSYSYATGYRVMY